MKLHPSFPRQKAFEDAQDFLRQAHGSTFDWTSAAVTFPPPAELAEWWKSTIAPYEKGKSAPTQRRDDYLVGRICNHFAEHGVQADPDNIVIDNSTLTIISHIYSLLPTGGKVLIPTPAFGMFVSQCNDYGKQPALLKTRREDGWKVTPEALEQALVMEKPQAFIFNNPVNPTGVMYTREEVGKLAEVLAKHPDVFVIADEIFAQMVLDGSEHVSIASMPGMQDRVATLSGVGKAFGIPDAHVSYGVLPEWMAREMNRPPLVLDANKQGLASKAFEKEHSEIRDYSARVAQACKINAAFARKKIDGINALLTGEAAEGKRFIAPVIDEPQASNVYLLSFEGLRGARTPGGETLSTGCDVARYLQKAAGVAMVPGEAFLMDENAMILRMTISTSVMEMERGFDAIGKACAELTPPPRHAPSRIGQGVTR